MKLHTNIRAGRGDPLVLLHAVGLDSTWWNYVISALPPDLAIIAFDLPGHGNSPSIEETDGFTAIADAIAAELTAISIHRYHLCGHSIGGMIAQHLAGLNPENIRTMTLIATAASFPETVRQSLRDRAATIRQGGMQAVAKLTIDRWFSPEFQRRRPEIITRCLNALETIDANIHARMWGFIAELETQQFRGGLSFPVQVIVGELDVATPPDCSRALAEILTASALHILPGSAHMAPIDNPSAIARLIMNLTCQHQA